MGWTWDYTEETLTVPRLKALQKHWEDHPPLPLMVAAYLDIKPKEKASEEDFFNMVSGLGHGVKFETVTSNG